MSTVSVVKKDKLAPGFELIQTTPAAVPLEVKPRLISHFFRRAEPSFRRKVYIFVSRPS